MSPLPQREYDSPALRLAHALKLHCRPSEILTVHSTIQEMQKDAKFEDQYVTQDFGPRFMQSLQMMAPVWQITPRRLMKRQVLFEEHHGPKAQHGHADQGGFEAYLKLERETKTRKLGILDQILQEVSPDANPGRCCWGLRAHGRPKGSRCCVLPSGTGIMDGACWRVTDSCCRQSDRGEIKRSLQSGKSGWAILVHKLLGPRPPPPPPNTPFKHSAVHWHVWGFNAPG